MPMNGQQHHKRHQYIRLDAVLIHEKTYTTTCDILIQIVQKMVFFSVSEPCGSRISKRSKKCGKNGCNHACELLRQICQKKQ